MSASPHPSEPPHSTPGHLTEEDPRLNTFLFNVLEAGDKVIQGLARQADLQAQPTPEGQTPHPVIDVAGQFECAARAIRRTVLLIRHLAQSRAACNASRNDPARQRTQARKRIIRDVEDAIQTSDHDPEPLRAEFRERLDAPDLEDDITSRPIADIVTDIVRDLGLEDFCGFHPWQRRTPRDLITLHARAAARPPPTYDPAPHGPDPGAPKPNHPRKPPDSAQEYREMVQLAKRLSST